MATNNLIFALQLNIRGFLDALRDALQGVDEFGDELEEIPDAADEATDSLDKSVLGMNAFAEAAQRVTEAGKSLFLAIQNSTEQYYSFNKAIAEVSTLVDTSITSNEQLSSSVQDLSQSFGKDAVGIAQGMYQAISAGAQAGSQANGLMTVALKTAVGGVTDVATAVDGLTTVVNAYGLDMSQADKVADGMFVTMKSGKTTIAELSSQYSQVIPIASALGISFDEVNAAVIGMTLQGTTTNVTMTQLKAALTALTKPSEELNAIFQKLGYISNEAAIKQEGFAFALNAVYEASGGSVSKINALLGSTEATGVVLSLAGEKAHFMTAGMEKLGAASGALNTAFDKVNANPFVQAEKAINSVKLAITRFGEQAVIALTPLTNAIRAVFDALNTFAKTSPVAFSVISQGITIVVGLTAGLGMLAAAIISTRFTMLLMSSAFTDVIASLGKMTAAIQAFSVLWGPLGIALAAAGAGYAAFSYLAQKSNEDLESSHEQLKTTLGFLQQFRNGLDQLQGSKIVDPAVVQELEQVRAAVMAGRMTQEEGLATLNNYLDQVKSVATEEQQLQDQIAAKQTQLNGLRENASVESEKQATQALLEYLTAQQAVMNSGFDRAIQDVTDALGYQQESLKQSGITQQEMTRQMTALESDAAQRIIEIEEERAQKTIALAQQVHDTKIKLAQQEEGKEAAKKIAEAEKELAQVRINASQTAYEAIRSNLEKTKQDYEQYAQRVIDLERAINNEQTSLEDKIRALRRKRMTESAQQADIEKEIQEKIAQAKEAAASGDQERAKQLADSVESLAGQLVVTSKAEQALKDASGIRQEALSSEKEIAVQQAAAAERQMIAQQRAAEAQRTAIEANTAALENLLSTEGTEKTINLTVQADEAQAQLEVLQVKLAELQDKTITVTVQTVEAKSGGGVIGQFSNLRFGMGAVVPGSGNADTVPAWLTPQEFVVRKARSLQFRPLLELLNYGSDSQLKPLAQLLNGFHFNLGGRAAAFTPLAI